MKQITLTIGIPALNEGANLRNLLDNIFAQDFNNIKIKKIIVASDGSKDNTVDIARSFKDNRMKVIDGKTRRGKNFRLNQIISETSSDILVLFDGDIIINDRKLIKKIIDPIISKKAELTSCEIYESRPRTFVEKALYVSMELKKTLFHEFKDGNNVYNCHGPARAFSSKLLRDFKFKNNCVDDMYSYLECVKRGERFIFVKEVGVLYRLPSNSKDHYKQSSRYHDEIENSRKIFGNEFIENEFNISFPVLIKATMGSIKLIMENFQYVCLYLVIFVFVNVGRLIKLSVGEKWEVSSSKIVI